MNPQQCASASASEEIPFAERLTCTILQACAVTGLSRTTIYEEIAAGRLKSTTVRRRRLVLVPSLLALVAGDEAAPPSQRAN
ncbi:hypothetical protein [Pseudolabrys taiwanensis]|uniref:hypothetical protein n=1 Tax=Pseudolabrys taiwanensis TaxID=331696 RepID=UPI001AECB474|nr:hypothetical protein [Pseudolabrys taiwanensis]